MERVVPHLFSPDDDAILDVVATAPDNFEQFYPDVTVKFLHAVKCRCTGHVSGSNGSNGQADKMEGYVSGVTCISIETYGRTRV